MKAYLVATALLATSAGFISSTAPAAWAQAVSAEQEFKAIQDLSRKGPQLPEGATRQQRMEAYDAFGQDLYAKLKGFYESHPSDPIRWRAVSMMGRLPLSFVKTYGPDYEKNSRDVVIDEAARSAFKAEVAAFEKALAVATDLPPDVRAAREIGEVQKAVADARKKGAATDWSALRNQVNAFTAKYPGEDSSSQLVGSYMTAFMAGRSVDAVLAEWKTFAQSPSPKVVELAAKEMVDDAKPAEVVKLKSGQVWLTDWEAAKAVAKRDGKKLFVDFTGSDWCGFCIKLENEVFTTEQFEAFAKDYVLVRLDFPRKTRLPLAERVQNATINRDFEIRGFPTILVTDAAGKEVHREVGYSPGSGWEKYLAKFTSKLEAGAPGAQ